MTVIQERDLIDSVADALQFISYYHPLDFIQAVHRAWEREQNPSERRHGTDFNQFSNVRGRPPTALPRYGYCDGLC